jgi:hypothetical protein
MKFLKEMQLPLTSHPHTRFIIRFTRCEIIVAFLIIDRSHDPGGAPQDMVWLFDRIHNIFQYFNVKDEVDARKQLKRKRLRSIHKGGRVLLVGSCGKTGRGFTGADLACC